MTIVASLDSKAPLIEMPPKEIRRPSGQLTKILAENLRDFRNSRRYSQEKFAELCGLHRTYIGSVERGERNVTLSTLEVFATVLSTTVPELLTAKEKPRKADAKQQPRDQ
jgi:transcriptional regulator with XRE-family HTH domain